MDMNRFRFDAIDAFYENAEALRIKKADPFMFYNIGILNYKYIAIGQSIKKIND